MTKNMEALTMLRHWLTDQHKFHLAGEPSEWEQKVWFVDESTADMDGIELPACGTACCAAGYTVTNLMGMRLSYDGTVYEGLARRGFVADVAEYYLGLSEDEAEDLFAGTNTYKDMMRMLDSWGVPQ